MEREGTRSNLLVGTSSWSSDDWVGPFYPPGTAPGDYLKVYAGRFPTVEVDSTFYRIPPARMVDSWDLKTPPGFVFSAKVPQVVTHEKALVGAEKEMGEFLEAMSRLGPKLGPLVLQFAYVAKGKDAEEYKTGARFRERLDAFLSRLPKEFRFAVEVRNPTWLDEDLLALLRRHRAALVLSAFYTMPALPQIEKTLDPVTSDFGFVRFIGDRKKIEESIAGKKEKEGKERDFDEVIVDRAAELRRWVPSLRRLRERLQRLLVYFNNHYAGFGPGSVAQFLEIWRELDASPGGGEGERRRE